MYVIEDTIMTFATVNDVIVIAMATTAANGVFAMSTCLH